MVHKARCEEGSSALEVSVFSSPGLALQGRKWDAEVATSDLGNSHFSRATEEKKTKLFRVKGKREQIS